MFTGVVDSSVHAVLVLVFHLDQLFYILIHPLHFGIFVRVVGVRTELMVKEAPSSLQISLFTYIIRNAVFE
jgi:hypothetical protein